MSKILVRLPDPAELRASLISCAKDFCEITGTTLPALGGKIAKDTSLFSDIKDGRNFTIGTYAKIRKWLGRNWPKDAPERPLRDVRTS